MRSVWLIVALLCVFSAYALSFEAIVTPTEMTIKANETAKFSIELSHALPTEELFEVYSNDVTWDVRPEQVLRVPAGKVLRTTLNVRPLNLRPGAYNLPVMFRRSGSNDVLKQSLYLELKSPFLDDNYLPAIRGEALIDGPIDPRRGMTLKLSLENQNQRNLDKVEVKVRSNVVNKDYVTSLGPLEKKTLTFNAELDPRTPAQKDSLQISIIVPDDEKAYQFDLFGVSYEVLSYGAVVPYVNSSKSFLKRNDNITLVNEGNEEVTHMYRIPAWLGKRLFVSGTPKPKVDGGLVWEIPLAPGQSARILVTYNYRPLFWLFLLTVIVLSAYFWFRSPIAVYKRAAVVTTHEGGITEVKVIVELVNRGLKNAHAISIMDMAPRLTDVSREFKETMLAPTKIVPHSERGTVMKWDVDVMEPKEHRLLMYRIKTRLQVLGGLSLPVAAVRFSYEGKEREAVSNKPEIRHKV